MAQSTYDATKHVKALDYLRAFLDRRAKGYAQNPHRVRIGVPGPLQPGGAALPGPPAGEAQAQIPAQVGPAPGGHAAGGGDAAGLPAPVPAIGEHAPEPQLQQQEGVQQPPPGAALAAGQQAMPAAPPQHPAGPGANLPVPGGLQPEPPAGEADAFLPIPEPQQEPAGGPAGVGPAPPAAEQQPAAQAAQHQLVPGPVPLAEVPVLAGVGAGEDAMGNDEPPEAVQAIFLGRQAAHAATLAARQAMVWDAQGQQPLFGAEGGAPELPVPGVVFAAGAEAAGAQGGGAGPDAGGEVGAPPVQAWNLVVGDPGGAQGEEALAVNLPPEYRFGMHEATDDLAQHPMLAYHIWEVDDEAVQALQGLLTCVGRQEPASRGVEGARTSSDGDGDHARHAALVGVPEARRCRRGQPPACRD